MQIKVDGNHGKRKQPQTPKAWNLKNEVKRGKNNKNGIRIRKKKKKSSVLTKSTKETLCFKLFSHWDRDKESHESCPVYMPNHHLKRS